MPPLKKNEISHALKEVFEKNNLKPWMKFISPNIVYRLVPLPDFVGIDAVKEVFENILKTYSENNLEVKDVVMEDDLLAMRWSWDYTHTGQSPYMPIPPTNKRLHTTGLTMLRFSDDKIVEMWDYMDLLGYMQQLGVALKI